MKKNNLFTNAIIVNPKQRLSLPAKQAERRLFPYYAGYSRSFVETLLGSLILERDALIFDPWNGSGTTIQVANSLGFNCIGVDLNPVMVIVAKASLIASSDYTDLVSIAKLLIEKAKNAEKIDLSSDLLCEWFMPKNALYIRLLETEINSAFVSSDHYESLTNKSTLNQLSAIGAFFYVVLFRIVRHFVKDFIPTNPTWIKQPKSPQDRKQPTSELVYNAFIDEVNLMIASLQKTDGNQTTNSKLIDVSLGNAEALKLHNNSVDVVVTSPPYCTRIDYAKATAIELAILRYSRSEFDKLRRSLMGSATVKAATGKIDSSWGVVCTRFLESVYNHPSAASKTYYFKNHLQYFASLQLGITELYRVLKPGGSCFLVVQDSYYKDVHNDIPAIAIQMAENVGMSLRRREDFTVNQSMVDVNMRAQKHLSSRKNTESVLCFERA